MRGRGGAWGERRGIATRPRRRPVGLTAGEGVGAVSTEAGREDTCMQEIKRVFKYYKDLSDFSSRTGERGPHH